MYMSTPLLSKSGMMDSLCPIFFFFASPCWFQSGLLLLEGRGRVEEDNRIGKQGPDCAEKSSKLLSRGGTCQSPSEQPEAMW